MYGTIPSEKIPSLEMLPPVSVSAYAIIPPPPASDSANAALSTPLIGMYVPTRDSTNSAKIVAIFPGNFPPKKSPIFASPLGPPLRPLDIARVALGLVQPNAGAKTPSSPRSTSSSPSGSNVPLAGGCFAYARCRTSRAASRGFDSVAAPHRGRACAVAARDDVAVARRASTAGARGASARGARASIVVVVVRCAVVERRRARRGVATRAGARARDNLCRFERVREARERRNECVQSHEREWRLTERAKGNHRRRTMRRRRAKVDGTRRPRRRGRDRRLW